MEEIQKKTRKENSSRKNNETSKVTATASKAKSSSTKKEPKISKVATNTKTNNATKDTKSPKTSTSTKATRTAKASNVKKETKSSEKNITKKEPKSPKTSTARKETNTNKKVEIIDKREKNKVIEEPKFTIIHEKKEEQKQVTKSKSPKEETQRGEAQKEKTPKKENKKARNKKEKNKIDKEQKNKAKKEKKAKKPKKGYIDISIGAIICTIIIIGLLVLNIKLGIKAYSIITKNQTTTTNSDVEADNDISVTQEVGNVLNNNDEIVTQMKEKITFAPNVTASIYNAETFSTNTISNDLKLQLGWDKIKEEHKLKSINENNESIEALEKEFMAESIKNIFGPKVKYKDEAFNNTNVNTFSKSCQNQGVITYDNGLYTSIVSENIEDVMVPIIYQEIQKVVKYSDKVIVYVKVAYMYTDGEKYIVYKNFDNEKFEEELLEISPEELFQEDSFDQYTGEGTVTINANSSLDSIRNQLDTYKYTFSLDGETGDYYLSKFNKALSIQ